MCSLISMIFISAAAGATAATGTGDRWVNPAVTPLECTRNGTFFQRSDGSLLTIESGQVRASTDGGVSWTPVGVPFDAGAQFEHVGHVGQFMQMRDGSWVVVYLDMAHINWGWNDERGEPNPDVKLEMWSVRSKDEGTTWIDKQRVLDGYNADFMGFIETRDGRLVASVEHLDPNIKRWVAMSLWSDDGGVTWNKSNVIDLGGHGHHDGALEPSVVELKDGRLMMWIRTNHDYFWKAYSNDGGRNWRHVERSTVEASSAPAWLGRMASGRLGLLWNPAKAEGATVIDRRPPGPGHANPTSWFREELCIAFSDDDGETWSKPVVIARQPKGQLSYPYFLERAPGELWVFTRYTFMPGGAAAPLQVRLKEQDFVK
ncbi:MAG: hypothetical protein AMXMBFR84_36890 [Candidatus Hydrogenedentota bacterium]